MGQYTSNHDTGQYDDCQHVIEQVEYRQVPEGPCGRVAKQTDLQHFREIGGPLKVWSWLRPIDYFFADQLEDFDIVHVCAATNGNHRIVAASKAAGCNVVLSTVMDAPFNRWLRLTAEFSERLVGRLTGWEVHTSQLQLQSALRNADGLIALSRVQRDPPISGYQIPEDRVSIIPNGIAPRFISADPASLGDTYDFPRPWVVCVAPVSEYKNQLGLIEALKDTRIHAVLAGEAPDTQRHYLARCLADPFRASNVGLLDYYGEFLPALYAAADACVLISQREVMSLSILEALAADSPSVVTKWHSLDLPERDSVIKFVDPSDPAAVTGLLKGAAAIPPGTRADTVRQFSWAIVGAEIMSLYQELLA